MAGGLVWVLLAVAVLITVASSIAVLMRDHFSRLHLITPVTSLAGPAVALAVSLRNGLGSATVTVLAIVVLLSLTGSALQNAMGRVVAMHRGDVDPSADIAEGGTS